jgi:ABC-2 type transport system permease protein
MPDFYSDPTPHTPETAPSALASDEMAFPRWVGTLGAGLAALGALVIVMNMSKERIIGPTGGAFFIFLGIAAMLYHAARDADLLVRRAYLGLGFGALIAGAVLGLLPKPVMGDWLMPWGGMGLLTGVFFLIAAGRHETEAPFDGITTLVLTLGGIALAALGLIGTGWATAMTPRFAGLAILGLIFWWAALGRLGPASESGYRLGRLLGWVGLTAFVVGAAVSLFAANRFFMPRGLMLMALGAMFWMLAFAMNSDRAIAAMTRRELAAYFYSPIAYIVLFGSVFMGWLAYSFFLEEFLLADMQMGMRPVREPIVRFYGANFYPVIAMMFVVPVVTMRLISEEKRTGTIEVLLTAPISEWSVVLSKFFAGLIFLLFLCLPWGLFLVPIYYLGRDGFDYLPLLSFYVALLCNGAAFVAMGLFFSSITRNQIVASVLSFAGMFLFVSFAFVNTADLSPALRATVDQLSFFRLWLNALGGKLAVHQLITFLSLAVFWLYLTTKVLEARKWS